MSDNSDNDEIVQDNKRETIIADLCGLTQTGKRAGSDAYDQSGNPYELKSTTRKSFSTARDVGLHTIQKWRQSYWIFAEGRNLQSGYQITALYIAHPDQLNSWFDIVAQQLEDRLRPCIQVIALAMWYGTDFKLLGEVVSIIQRGITLNNPHIPSQTVYDNTVRLGTGNHEKVQAQLIEFIQQHPLNR